MRKTITPPRKACDRLTAAVTGILMLIPLAACSTGNPDPRAASSSPSPASAVGARVASDADLPEYIVNGDFSYPGAPWGRGHSMERLAGHRPVRVRGHSFARGPDRRLGCETVRLDEHPDRRACGRRRTPEPFRVGQHLRGARRLRGEHEHLPGHPHHARHHARLAAAPHKRDRAISRQDERHDRRARTRDRPTGDPRQRQRARRQDRPRRHGHRHAIRHRTPRPAGGHGPMVEGEHGPVVGDVHRRIPRARRQTVTRFRFLNVDSRSSTNGNLLDDIVLGRLYPLHYDGNGNTRGSTPEQKQ